MNELSRDLMSDGQPIRAITNYIEDTYASIESTGINDDDETIKVNKKEFLQMIIDSCEHIKEMETEEY